MMTRAEHVRWCKTRALEYINMDDARNALTSMMSDLRKHPETESLVDSLGMLFVFEMMNPSVGSAKRFIEGFAE